ncbi:MAG: PepSY domain-containing protein [Pseudomonadota bacterium]
MQRFSIALTLALALTLFGGHSPASAQESIQDQVVRQLGAAGYETIEVSRTLLGRLRFVASDATRRREIVVHPTTGAILFDRLTDAAGQVSRRVPLSDDDDDDDNEGDPGGSTSGGGSGSGSGTGGEGARDDDNDDAGDDDDGDDDDDDDGDDDDDDDDGDDGDDDDGD